MIVVKATQYKVGPEQQFLHDKSSCGSVVEHYVSSAKVVGSIPREYTYWNALQVALD